MQQILHFTTSVFDQMCCFAVNFFVWLLSFGDGDSNGTELTAKDSFNQMLCLDRKILSLNELLSATMIAIRSEGSGSSQ